MNSPQIDTCVKKLLKRAIDAKGNALSPNCVGKSTFVILVAKLSGKEVKAMRAYILKHTNDVEGGLSDVLIALIAINGLLPQPETPKRNWEDLRPVARISRKLFDDIFFNIGGEYQLNFPLSILLQLVLACSFIGEVIYLVRRFFRQLSPLSFSNKSLHIMAYTLE